MEIMCWRAGFGKCLLLLPAILFLGISEQHIAAGRGGGFKGGGRGFSKKSSSKGIRKSSKTGRGLKSSKGKSKLGSKKSSGRSSRGRHGRGGHGRGHGRHGHGRHGHGYRHHGYRHYGYLYAGLAVATWLTLNAYLADPYHSFWGPYITVNFGFGPCLYYRKYGLWRHLGWNMFYNGVCWYNPYDPLGLFWYYPTPGLRVQIIRDDPTVPVVIEKEKDASLYLAVYKKIQLADKSVIYNLSEAARPIEKAKQVTLATKDRPKDDVIIVAPSADMLGEVLESDDVADNKDYTIINLEQPTNIDMPKNVPEGALTGKDFKNPKRLQEIDNASSDLDKKSLEQQQQ